MKRTCGFTLIELSVVVVIIGIMASLVAARIFRGYQERARVAEAAGILSAISRGQVAYFDRHGFFLAATGALLQPDEWEELGLQVPPGAGVYWDYGIWGTGGNDVWVVARRTGFDADPGLAGGLLLLSSDGTWTGSGPYAPGGPYAPTK
ncbi:MAG: hypothetical protein A3G87_09135 [Omnitrophica bacterium RIFCSPLOWO2_12_FULL_50_11]|nr:MAG: hypothetical protein A3G87_09135 [Omnitrophica bacterium RIFCSPLOWO2_12_FULL_50_11]